MGSSASKPLVAFAQPERMIKGKEVRAKLLDEDCGLYRLNVEGRKRLASRFPEASFQDPQRMSPHVTMLTKEEFENFEKGPIDWSSYTVSPQVADVVLRRVGKLQNTSPILCIESGRKSIGVEFECEDAPNCHMTIAYYPSGLPDGAVAAIQELIE